jgi:4,5-dihydroxyphthalate decarboxylase
MQLIVLRRNFHEQHPFAATSLYQAFCASKALAFKKMRYLGTLRYMLPWMTADLDEIEEVFGGDPWPYGVEPNRAALEALVQYLVDQPRRCRCGSTICAAAGGVIHRREPTPS